MPGTISAKDLLDRLDKYHDEIVAFAQQTTQNAQTLKDATALINDQKDTLWSKFKPWIPIAAIILIIVSILIMKPMGVCQVSISVDKGLDIQRCEQKTLQTAH